MKRLRMFALFALLLVAVGSSLGQLPASQGVKADVPFAFSAGNEMFPAGEYTVRLTVNGRTYTQPLVVKPDPRLNR